MISSDDRRPYVLIVDDDQDALTIAQLTLDWASIPARTASTASEAPTTSRIATVAVTGMPELLDDVHDVKFDWVLTKPVPPNNLAQIVRSLLATSEVASIGHRSLLNQTIKRITGSRMGWRGSCTHILPAYARRERRLEESHQTHAVRRT